MPPLPVNTKIEPIKLKDLEFDRLNPRLAGYGIKLNTPDEEVTKILWEEMAVDEVAMSIAASGYWGQEPLIVADEKGKHVVIEGNRRLAAVRALIDPAIAKSVGTALGANLKPEVLATFDPLPAIKTTRRDSWRYLGFKHVNGPARWGSYAKAEYIRRVHSEYRHMTGEQRLAIALRLHELSCDLAREGIRQQHPKADEAEVERLLRQRLGLANFQKQEAEIAIARKLTLRHSPFASEHTPDPVSRKRTSESERPSRSENFFRIYQSARPG